MRHASARSLAIGAIASMVWLSPVAAAPVRAQTVPPGVVSLTMLSPTTILDVAGSHTGSVDALAVRDESGASDDRAGFVRLNGGDHRYVGERTYTLSPTVSPGDVTTIALTGNFRGPVASRIAWTWSIHDVATDRWVRLGTQDHCGGDAGTAQWPCDDLSRRPWKYVRWNVIHAPGATLADFVDPVTREIRIRLRSSAPSVAKLDWEALEVYSSHAAAPAVWTPSVGARWQWQLQGKPGSHEATGGIAVGICRPPFGGGACVRPDVFDFDLYVDPSIAGRFGYELETAAVDAVHASGRHAIGYVTAGDAERWRPDYEQYVDFDHRCGGCLLGNPFSRRFPDEYWANFGRGKGRFVFMLQMLRARTDRVAATGFDGIEYDIVDTYAQGARYTGFHVSARTQLAYNRALAAMAHADGLSVALKNDGEQIPQLLDSFDYAINEQCFQYDECGKAGDPTSGWRAFISAGKPVFEAEYRRTADAVCPTANRWDFSTIVKSRTYNLYAMPWTPCR
jgi:endo-alpha-1,4-polygalactosaminidase (GH114 family)